jgi:hypothetical protein
MVKNLPKKTVDVETAGRINLTLPKDLDERLNRYVLEVARKQGKIPYAIRTKIVRIALEEWLSNHEDDLDAIRAESKASKKP